MRIDPLSNNHGAAIDVNASDEDRYEVEEILDVKSVKRKNIYKLKWKGYTKTSWEPEEHLECPELLATFWSNRTPTTRKRKRAADDANPSRSERKGVQAASNTGRCSTVPKLNSGPARRGSGQTAIVSSLQEITRQTSYSFGPLQNTPQLEAWKALLVDAEYETVVSNLFDNSGPPENFEWTEKLVYTGTDIPDTEFTIACECKDFCGKDCSCILEYDKENEPYDSDGRVREGPAYGAIYECNWRKIPLEIFRCGDARGWGVRTLQRIAKGQFISKYVGEMITSEEAEKRGKTYDTNGATFLFDIDYDIGEYDGDGAKYCVDAYRKGNIARFFNHSCDPNIASYAVFIDNLSPEQHELAFFAMRDVDIGEELTFDYAGSKDPHRPKRATACLCGANNCRGFVPL
ncbi:histone-lysine N-methyltransferase [Spizellomyces sp. 'palustris']|nr:histone-lysine N-methyltransferase [Spizellomyces sp. 'palustris']